MKIETIGDATLYLGDCRKILADVDPQRPCLITDPPYGVNWQANKPSRVVRPYWNPASDQRTAIATDHQFPNIVGDDKPFDPSHLLHFQNAILWGANHYADRLPASSCWLSWDKKCGKAANSDIGDCELAWVRGLPYVTVRAFRHMWAGFQRDSQVGEPRHHPTEKPIALFEWCIGFFSNAQTIVDPYMGAGASGVACARMGRSYVGIEIEERYFSTACRRIEAAQRQKDLFVHAPVAEDPVEARIRDMFAEPEG